MCFFGALEVYHADKPGTTGSRQSKTPISETPQAKVDHPASLYATIGESCAALIPKATLPPSPTLTYQNLLFCRVPIRSILGCRIRTYKNGGFGRLR